MCVSESIGVHLSAYRLSAFPGEAAPMQDVADRRGLAVSQKLELKGEGQLEVAEKVEYI